MPIFFGDLCATHHISLYNQIKAQVNSMEDFDQFCPFTHFTHELFAKATLNNAIYHLQHNSGFNINIILYLLWLGKAYYGRVTKRHIRALESQITLWHQRVLSELKYTHALVENHADLASTQIKEALQEEIVKAHWVEQHMLYNIKLKTHILRRTPQQQLTDACASIIHYCELKNDLLVDEDQAAFIQIFSAVFDEIEKTEIEKQILSAFDRLKIISDQPAQMVWQEF